VTVTADTATVAQASNSRPTRRTRDGDFYLATSEDFDLAIYGDFLMATDTLGTE
jgi:hypothetical protein